MNIRKAIALLLSLCLMISAVPALAAPTRDARAVEVTVDEKLMSLVEIIVNAAILQCSPADPGIEPTIPGLAADETPSDLLVSCALAWGIKAGLLPYDKEVGEQETITLGKEKAENLYRRVFTSAAYSFKNLSNAEIEALKAEYGPRTWYLGWELNMAYASLCNYGVYIYSAEFDGTDVEILCDVFSTKDTEIHQSAEDIPEEALVWRCNAAISLRSAPESAFGYTLNSFAFSPFYLDGDLIKWPEFENAEMEYTVNLPTVLGVSDDTPANRVWQTADGTAALTIAAQGKAVSYDEALAEYMAAHPGAKINQQREFDCFSEAAEGRCTLIVVSEMKGNVFTVTLTFPAERQAEFELYAEIIRNSLILWGVSNG